VRDCFGQRCGMKRESKRHNERHNEAAKEPKPGQTQAI